MMGVLTKYFVKKVLHFNHPDFIRAMKLDLGPLLGETGIWVLTQYVNKCKEKKKDDKKKRVMLCIEMVKNYLENGLDYMGKENKYNFMNKFGPKKFPDQHIFREKVPFIYSW